MRSVCLTLWLWFLAGPVAAQSLEVECVDRQECELDMLAACPEGAVILQERLKAAPATPEPSMLRVMSYVCGQRWVMPNERPRSADDARRALIDAREQARPGQIQLLQQQRSQVRLAGPLILTLVGVGTTSLAWSLAARSDDPAERKALLVSSVFPMTLLVLPGAIWLTKSVRKRRELRQQIEELRFGRSRLVPSLAASPHELRGGLSLSF